jgi:hypothetical protein
LPAASASLSASSGPGESIVTSAEADPGASGSPLAT